MTNSQVAEAFASGDTTGNSNNLFIEKRGNDSTVIFSYGYHFPIAIKTSDLFSFFNIDGYSQTTACHKGLVKRALEAEGIEIEGQNTDFLIKKIEEISRNRK